MKRRMLEKTRQFLKERKQRLPSPIINSLAFKFLESGVDLILSRRDLSIPPKRLMFDGPADYILFKQSGKEFLGYYINLCGLKPNESILDVGSGIGRKTFPLTNYLSDDGEYWGLEVNKTGVDWCKKKISKRHPNFHFQVIDVYHSSYNPQGSQKGSEYELPFPEDYFDFVVVCSVFTHIFPAEVENYLGQISRVLKPGKRCLITYFLLNQESMELVANGKSSLDFKYTEGVCRTMDLLNPEAAVGYEENYILDLYQKFRLTVKTPIHYGSWCGRSSYLSYQDIIIATKDPKET